MAAGAKVVVAVEAAAAVAIKVARPVAGLAVVVEEGTARVPGREAGMLWTMSLT